MPVETTPMMRQYMQIKETCTDAILFFRLGDFYEMFQRDAKEASALLNLTLTRRHGIPMCGIPYHAASTYIARLLRAGRKVAICEQVSPPKKGKEITRREVVEILTPGTVVDENFLDQSSNNYMLALGKKGNILSASYIDSSTGEFFTQTFPVEQRIERVRELFYRLNPREIIIQESLIEEDKEIASVIGQQHDLLVNRFPDWSFDLSSSASALKSQFQVLNLKGFGLEEDDPAIYSAGVLLEYLEETSKAFLPHIRGISKLEDTSRLGLDESTQKNLELVRNLRDGSRKYTLLEVLDQTKTAPGSRKLRKWLLHPLTDHKDILERQKKVEEFYHNQLVLSSIRECLAGMLDLERLSARVAMDKAHAKDLLGIKSTLTSSLQLADILEAANIPSPLQQSKEGIQENIVCLKDLLEKSICNDPSILLTEGRLIREQYSPALDKFKALEKNSKSVLQEYLNQEKAESGISSLKIRYNKIIGYYLEVTKSNLQMVPEHFIRRQSLVGSERFTTDKLVELETELNSVSEKIIALEKDLFLAVRNQVKESVIVLLDVAGMVSEIDCYQSLAQAATIHGYVKPAINNSSAVSISGGRHPVVEAYLPPGEFIPNSLHLGGTETGFILLTGPNMAGKSTYLRQTALITLMAQMGSFVPADEASVGIVDRIFCRVGASDNLARGESTFLVEMNETSHILRTATEKSLVIMDEVGRGTSTHDGLSIAWAVSEYLLHTVKAKTLFATHYHELTLLEHPRFANFSMEVHEEKGRIVFLKRVKEGPAGQSYGIHVAGLAGLPEAVLLRAEELLSSLQTGETGAILTDTEVKNRGGQKQRELFSPTDIVKKNILSVRIDTLTPLEALNLIAEWQNEIKQEEQQH